MHLEILGLTKKFGKCTAVDNANYVFSNGIYGLLGVNGAGKTTLMKMLCTLMQPTDGKIYCNGKDVNILNNEYRKIIGYLPQDFGGYPYFTVEEYLNRIALLKGLSVKEANLKVPLVLGKVGLAERKANRIRTLSGGMLRRLGIAQALIGDPQILVLDEPTAGLDPSERIRFRHLISDLSENKTVLVSTHIVSDVEYVANEIIMMRKGRLRLCGSREQIISTTQIKAWRCVVQSKLLSSIERQYRVSNIKRINDTVELRILSKVKPLPIAIEENVTLEDIFLYYNNKGSATNDLL